MKGICVRRTDRLGARLCPILNGYFMSVRYSVPFVFSWPGNSGMEQAEAIFKKDFVTKHAREHIPLHETPQIELSQDRINNTVVSYAPSDFFSCREFARVNHPFGVHIAKGDGVGLIAHLVSQAFLHTALRDDLRALIERLSSQCDGAYTSIHFRRGDLADFFLEEGNERELFLRFVPETVLDHVKSKAVLVFTDERDVLTDRVQANFFTDVVATALGGLTPVQVAFVESLMLSFGGAMVTGKSGFASFSTLLSGVPSEHPVFVMGGFAYAKDMLDKRDHYIERIPNALIVQSLLWGVKELSKQGHGDVAIEMCEALKTQPHQPGDVYEAWGHAHMLRSEFAEAKAMFLRAREFDDRLSCLSALARAHRRLHEAAALNAVLDEIERKFPDEALAQTTLAQLRA